MPCARSVSTKRAVVLRRADLGVERAVVDDVVPVRRAGARFEIRRRVDVRDAQRGEIRHERRRVGEAEAGVELQPVRRARRHDSRNQPTLQGGSGAASARAGTSPSVKTAHARDRVRHRRRRAAEVRDQRQPRAVAEPPPHAQRGRAEQLVAFAVRAVRQARHDQPVRSASSSR